MATLSVAERREIWGNFMRMLSAEGENIPGIVKNDLLNAVNGLDNLMNASEETINNAIPNPARSAMTTKQKAMLLMYVITARYMMVED